MRTISNESEYSATEFLSPSRSPRHRVSLFGRRDSPAGGDDYETPRKNRAMLSPGQLKKLSPFAREPDVADDDGDVEGHDIGGLLSPQLEKQLHKEGKTRTSFLAPLAGIRKSLTQSLHVPGLGRRKDDDDEDNSSIESEEEYETESDEEEEDEDAEEVATEDDMMLLLARELELMDGSEEDEDYDDDDDSR
eukprot:Nitzschia sp. Nitz4//scaffold15_size197535//33917//34492//NITZ4_001559-RA/size197535-processed-gene-0.8-mRNA-1//1//CDS//3329537658//3676//frame0